MKEAKIFYEIRGAMWDLQKGGNLYFNQPIDRLLTDITNLISMIMRSVFKHLRFF